MATDLAERSRKGFEHLSCCNLSVGITALNAQATITSYIESILGVDYPPDAFEVIVVDGGSRDSSLAKPSVFEGVTILHDPVCLLITYALSPMSTLLYPLMTMVLAYVLYCVRHVAPVYKRTTSLRTLMIALLLTMVWLPFWAFGVLRFDQVYEERTFRCLATNVFLRRA